MSTSSNCTQSLWPHGQVYSYPVYNVDYPVKIRTVENGIVVSMDHKEFVFTHFQELVSFLKEHLAHEE